MPTVGVPSGEWTDFWVYVAGPVLGATTGGVAYQLVRGDQPKLAAEPGQA